MILLSEEDFIVLLAKCVFYIWLVEYLEEGKASCFDNLVKI